MRKYMHCKERREHLVDLPKSFIYADRIKRLIPVVLLSARNVFSESKT